jgi:hypothetical protein
MLAQWVEMEELLQQQRVGAVVARLGLTALVAQVEQTQPH